MLLHENHHDVEDQNVWSNMIIGKEGSLHLFVVLLPYQGIFKSGPIQICPREFGTSDDSICELSTRQVCICEVNPIQDCVCQVSACKPKSCQKDTLLS